MGRKCTHVEVTVCADGDMGSKVVPIEMSALHSYLNSFYTHHMPNLHCYATTHHATVMIDRAIRLRNCIVSLETMNNWNELICRKRASSPAFGKGPLNTLQRVSKDN